MSTSSRLGRYQFIDALRGIAAVLVMMFHAKLGGHINELVPSLPNPLVFVMDHGDTGVFIFFVISGFVIANSLAPCPVTARDAGVFMLKRSIRLDPPYWASMALVVALTALSLRVVPGKQESLPSLTDVLVHVAYLPELLGTPLINEVYWSLCLEIQFYIVFAFMMMGATRANAVMGRERALDAVLVPATVVANLWAVDLAPFHWRGLFIENWYMFLAGVWVWRAVTRSEVGDHWPTIVASANGCILGAAALQRESAIVAVGTATTLLVLVVGLWGGLRSGLSWRPFQFLGSISYSLYLTHNSLTGAGFRAGYMFTGRNAALEALWLVLVSAGCIVAAGVFHRLIEAPTMILSRTVFGRHHATRAAAPAPTVVLRC